MQDRMAQVAQRSAVEPPPTSAQMSVDHRSAFALSAVDRSLWGDGFDEDTLWQLTGVRHWPLCSTDELARLFPGLLCPDTAVSGDAIDRLAGVVSRRSAQIEGRRASGRRSAEHLAEIAREDRALALLSSHLTSFELKLKSPFDPVIATTFAFHAGLHPGYFWSEACVTHGRETTACWLGLIARGRSARLVCEVSEFLAESLKIHRGNAVLADPIIADLAAGLVDLDALLRAVEDHRRGRRPIVRSTSAASRMRAAMQTGRAVVASFVFHGVNSVFSPDVTGKR